MLLSFSSLWHMQKQFDTKVKCFRSDNAKDLGEGEAQKFYVEHDMTLNMKLIV